MDNQVAFLKLPSGIYINLAHISVVHPQRSYLAVYCTGRADPLILSDLEDRRELRKALEGDI